MNIYFWGWIGIGLIVSLIDFNVFKYWRYPIATPTKLVIIFIGNIISFPLVGIELIVKWILKE